MSAAHHVLLIVAGGTGIPLAVAAVARLLVEDHAESTAAAIRHHYTTHPTVPTGGSREH
ncbi:hypothetical protein [Salinispora arenicola]|uniref:hypothetical protein n=1 Tax=Salinispora arenicola TaxID=168697 RepID=UPI0016B450AD|nr:hypothetical protein [Salinispora arenicola]NIL56221.1 hypothetical protein [Salinispora arenicola]NIL62148.1 hypothetical protein [Salinispora arenicola]